MLTSTETMRHTFWDGCWNLTADWKLIRQSTTANAKENSGRGVENALVIMEKWAACCSWKGTGYILSLPLVQRPAYFRARWSTSLSLFFNERSLKKKFGLLPESLDKKCHRVYSSRVFIIITGAGDYWNLWNRSKGIHKGTLK